VVCSVCVSVSVGCSLSSLESLSVDERRCFWLNLFNLAALHLIFERFSGV
jgi:hypothetical protein